MIRAKRIELGSLGGGDIPSLSYYSSCYRFNHIKLLGSSVITNPYNMCDQHNWYNRNDEHNRKWHNQYDQHNR